MNSSLVMNMKSWFQRIIEYVTTPSSFWAIYLGDSYANSTAGYGLVHSRTCRGFTRVRGQVRIALTAIGYTAETLSTKTPYVAKTIKTFCRKSY